MERENILVILYEMAMAIGGETRLKPLLTRTLQRLLYHTSFPAGFVCLDLPPPAPGEETVEVRLDAVVGDYELTGLAEQPLRLPAALLRGAAEQVKDAALLAQLPGAPGRYRAFLRLPVNGSGVIVLLAPRMPETDLPLTSLFQPTMAHLARAIVLCRHHETYTAGLVQALQETKEHYQSIFAGARDGIVLIDAETGLVTDCNPEFERQCGRPLAQFKSLHIWDLRPPEARKVARAKFEEIKATGSGGSAELALQRPDGTIMPIEFMSTRIRIGGREFLQSICRDITERRRAEQELRRTHELLERMFESIHVLVAYTDRDFNFIRVNRAYAEADGRTPEFFPGKNHFVLYPGKEVEAIFRKVVDTGEPYTVLERPFVYAEHPERGTSYWDWRVEPVKNTGGRVEGLIFSLLNVTERVLTERRLRAGLERTVEAIAATIEMRDPYTAGHERRVVELATAIARELGLAEEKTEGLRFAALVHDIGKIRIPAEILSKPAALSPIEFEMIKGHCQVGYDILKGIEFPWPVARIVLEHHERLDGSGYPNGLKGEQTLLESKILAVADVVEAMASHRPYRPALGIDAALEEIARHRGTRYAPQVVDVCMRVFREKGFAFAQEAKT